MNQQKVYIAWVCSQGHTSPVYIYDVGVPIEQPSECQHPVRHVAEDKLDIGFAKVDRPVAVWFPKKGEGLPWMSMMRACGCKFIDCHIAPEGMQVEIITKGKQELSNSISSSTSASVASLTSLNVGDM
jgi:hypothetical protein